MNDEHALCKMKAESELESDFRFARRIVGIQQHLDLNSVASVQLVHEKTAPPKYNGVVFEILGKHH